MEQDPTWTPGPWAIDGHNLAAVIVETKPKHWDKIAECGSHDNWRANARLIAAAPDLHEALVATLQLVKVFTRETDEVAMGVRQMAESALAKAVSP